MMDSAWRFFLFIGIMFLVLFAMAFLGGTLSIIQALSGEHPKDELTTNIYMTLVSFGFALLSGWLIKKSVRRIKDIKIENEIEDDQAPMVPNRIERSARATPSAQSDDEDGAFDSILGFVGIVVIIGLVVIGIGFLALEDSKVSRCKSEVRAYYADVGPNIETVSCGTETGIYTATGNEYVTVCVNVLWSKNLRADSGPDRKTIFECEFREEKLVSFRYVRELREDD